ncbi:hypothetical protein KY284_030205 [Solanum tuberosum]|nr:hypothetical protein KY284_030205 [Solanum tuberosum]
MEPFQDPQELEQYKRRLGMLNAYCNCSAKIWLFWEEDWCGEVVKDSAQQLTMKISKHNMEFLLTAVYARCDELERLELWEELEDIADGNNKPWLVGGDFNVIMNEDEKQGGLNFTQYEAMDFSQCINNCALIEMKYVGSKFTWWNGRIEGECIFKRLDRVFGNQEFFDILPSSEVHHLVRQGSDHAPLQVRCSSNEEPTVRPFRFLNFWTKHPNFKKIIEENWKLDFVGCPFFEYQARIKKIKGVLAKWSKETFGNIFQQIATLEDEIRVKKIQLEINASPENRAELKKTEAELKKSCIWRTNSGNRRQGCDGRRKKLQLTQIQTAQGDVITTSENIGAEAVSFFGEQFKEDNTHAGEEMLDIIPKIITVEQNNEMIRIPTTEEVKQVVFELNADSASGPDGFSDGFCQRKEYNRKCTPSPRNH